MPAQPLSNIESAKNELSARLLTPRSSRSLQMLVLNAFRDESLRWPLLTVHAFSLEAGGVRALKVASMLRDTPPIVHAVGIGRKIVQGTQTNMMAVRVYVTRKANLSDLSESEKIPATVDGAPTDLIEAPPANFLTSDVFSCTQNRTVANRPLIAGVSTSHINGDTGTVGYFCQSTDVQDCSSDIFVLSNAHIYANYGAAQKGDDLIQKGLADGGTAKDRVAQFHRGVPLIFGSRNDVDAAIGLLSNVQYRAEICLIGKVNGNAPAMEGDEVAKHGRTTGYTEGIIDDELVDFIMLPSHSQSYIQFKDQMRIVPRPPHTVFAQAGDSGSLIVKRSTHEAAGLLHAAAMDGSYAYANHIDKVLNSLHVALI